VVATGQSYLLHENELFGRDFPSASPLISTESCQTPNKNDFQPEAMEKPFCNLYYRGEAKNSGFPRLLHHM
jgi:hypothetical protein